MGLLVLAVVACFIGLAVRRHLARRHRRPVPSRVRVALLLDHLGLGDVARVLGITPDFGFLQHRALTAALALRTLSVRGTARLSGALDVDIADQDWPTVAAAPEAFLNDIEVVLRSEAAERGWEIAGQFDLRFANLGDATPGRPAVALALHRDIGRTPATMPLAGCPLENVQQPVNVPRTEQFAGPLVSTALVSTSRPLGLVLLSSDPTVAPLRVSCTAREVIVGRGDDADLRVSHPTISARHCRLSRGSKGTWEILDLQSKNGTWVNAAQAERPLPLTVGDAIVLGSVGYEVVGL